MNWQSVVIALGMLAATTILGVTGKTDLALMLGGATAGFVTGGFVKKTP